jgi:2-amino-4-hydroxy-6-hydroxymethyldihydropteridine diphosphokinase
MELLRFMPGIELLAVSRYRETRPIGGPADQGAYLNGACLVETELPPHQLLGTLCAVENTLDRQRDRRWDERTIDLDLLLYGDLVVDSPELTIPHPRMATRRFVLEPSAEIAAELSFPPAACTVADLLDNISATHPLVSVVGVPGSGAAEVAAAVADATLARLITAPVPLPVGLGSQAAGDRLLEMAEAWRQPLLADSWEDDPHGTILDYWLDAVPAVAAEEVAEADRERFQRAFERLAGDVIAPHVAIFLRLNEADIEERLAFRRGGGAAHTDVFADLPLGSAATLPDEAAALIRLQDQLERQLRCPEGRCPRAPKAVITIAAGDLAAAAAEATAAVEAML